LSQEQRARKVAHLLLPQPVHFAPIRWALLSAVPREVVALSCSTSRCYTLSHMLCMSAAGHPAHFSTSSF
jgi:hypothetical protein